MSWSPVLTPERLLKLVMSVAVMFAASLLLNSGSSSLNVPIEAAFQFAVSVAVIPLAIDELNEGSVSVMPPVTVSAVLA